MPTRLRGERGSALIETAMTLPLLLLVTVGILEFGRMFQTWQVLTNAAREGARVAVLPSVDDGAPEARALEYVAMGTLDTAETTVDVDPVSISIGGGDTAPGSQVTVNYPFAFIVLQPIAQLVMNGSAVGEPFTFTVSAAMRNESAGAAP